MLSYTQFIVEISQQKAAVYLKRAVSDHSMASMTLKHVDGEEKEKLLKFEKRRRQGISRAVDRGGLNEDDEQPSNIRSGSRRTDQLDEPEKDDTPKTNGEFVKKVVGNWLSGKYQNKRPDEPTKVKTTTTGPYTGPIVGKFKRD